MGGSWGRREDRCAVPGAHLEQPVPWRMSGWCFRGWEIQADPICWAVSPSPGTGGEGEQKRQSSHRSKQSQECLKEAATAGGDCLVCSVLPGIPVQLELWHFAL